MLSWRSSHLRATESSSMSEGPLRCRLCNQLEPEWTAKCSLKNIFLFTVSCIYQLTKWWSPLRTWSWESRESTICHLSMAGRAESSGEGESPEATGPGVPWDWFSSLFAWAKKVPSLSLCGALCLLEDFHPVCISWICSRNDILPSKLGCGWLQAGNGSFSSHDFLGLSGKKSQVTINCVFGA